MMLGVFPPLSKWFSPPFVEQVCDNGDMAILYMEFYSEVFLNKNHNTHRGTRLWIVNE